MKVTNSNPFYGESTMEIECTPEQLNAWERGMLIQDAMPNIPAEQREFLISGFTPEQWKETFG